MRACFVVFVGLVACSSQQSTSDGGADATIDVAKKNDAAADSGVDANVCPRCAVFAANDTPATQCDSDGRCVPCVDDSQCPPTPPIQEPTYVRCQTLDKESQTYGNCVECLSNADCTSGVCYPYTHTCTTVSCAADAGVCGAPDGGPTAICDSTGACVECESTSDCQSGSQWPYCDTVSKGCVECLLPTDCPYSNAGCYEGHCGWCGANADCMPNETCVLPLLPTEGLPAGGCSCANDQGCGGDAPHCHLDGGTQGTCGP